MFREIRSSERITDQMIRQNNMTMAILDKRISDTTREELRKVKATEEKFDPDKRIRV